MSEQADMISTSEVQEFVPFGRQYMGQHPGKVPLQLRRSSVVPDHGLPLVKALRDFSLKDTGQKDSWKLRKAVGWDSESGEEDELYINGNTVVWSRGSCQGAGHILKSYTIDNPVESALWCSFLLPKDIDKDHDEVEADDDVIPCEVQTGVCVVEASCVSVFTTTGREYVTALPFPVAHTWPIKNGLLFERTVTPTVHGAATPKRDQPSLPVLFSMLHPLDEVVPVICRTGGNSANAKVSYVTEVTQSIVFTCEEPSLVLTYDKLLSVHSVFTIRRARNEEGCAVLGNATGFNQRTVPTTPGQSLLYSQSHSQQYSQQSISLSKLTLSSQSPSNSPFRSYSSRINSPSTGMLSKVQSPSVSFTGQTSSRTQSPSIGAANLFRLHSPSPQRRSPAGYMRTPTMSANVSMAEQSFGEFQEPLMPEICIDHLWTESASVPRDGALGRASKAFLTTDMCGQNFLAYLAPYRHHLRLVKYEESNDRSQLIFGSITIIQAKDAVPLTGLNMLIVAELNGSIQLYSGTTKVNQIHISGLPLPLTMSQSDRRQSIPLRRQSAPFGSPPRLALSGGMFASSGHSISGGTFASSGGHMSGHMSGPITSSRPPSALDIRFDDEVEQLSPVRSEFNESGMSLGTSMEDLGLAAPPARPRGVISALKDAVGNKFTIELLDGTMFRASVPDLSSCPIVRQCLKALKQVLPKDVVMQLLIRWYKAHNAPGSVNGQSEWTHFEKCVLTSMGYVTTNSVHTNMEMEQDFSPETAPKKAKPSDQGSDDDWQYLLGSKHHTFSSQCWVDLTQQLADKSSNSGYGQQSSAPDTSSLLYHHTASVFFAIHLVYEDFKLDALHVDNIQPVAEMLHFIARELHLTKYMDLYGRDFPQLLAKTCNTPTSHALQQERKAYPQFFRENPPAVYKWACELLGGAEVTPFPYIPCVTSRTKHMIMILAVLLNKEGLTDSIVSKYIRRVSAIVPRAETSLNQSSSGHRPPVEEGLPMETEQGKGEPFERGVLLLSKLDSLLKHESLTFGMALPLREAIYRCRQNPPADWPEEVYKLIDRPELARQRSGAPTHHKVALSGDVSPPKGTAEEEDGMEYLDQELLQLRFSDDLRIAEVRRLLQSARPVKISLTQRPEVSDHEFIEEQERHLYSTCIRTMALPMGRGMLTLSTYHPVPTETLPIPKLCLTGRAPPRNTTVDLSHIDTPPNMAAWPQFHNGVAAALRIANSSEVDSTWILYNKPRSNEVTNEHAGFLMGLGLNGHLNELAKLNVHDYLCKGHEFTSVGLLLGIAAEKRGTMDVDTTKLLSIHLSALLPPTSTELEIAHNIQVAAVLGIGLVYQGTMHRHISEVLLSEIGRPPGPEMENCTDRESYSLAAGLALGLVMLGKGSDIARTSDLNVADQLYNYMVGGHKRPLNATYRERYKSPSYQIKEGDSVNVDVTSPGATLALGMMFFNSGSSAVAEWLTPPDTQYLLDFVRPDFLMLRVIARGLVLWDQVHPSEEWINSCVPEIVQKYRFSKWQRREDHEHDVDFETMSQAYSNIMAGACMVVGLRFAGTANQGAFKCLMDLIKKVINLLPKTMIAEQAGRSTLENGLITILLSLAMVMAGTGNLEVLRVCRFLRSRVGSSYNYIFFGSHMAVSMAIGLLFLGGGRYTLSNKPDAVAAMLCAFFPKFPIHSNDNRYHLQAFRHLYVLAAEPRVIIPRDVVTGNACYVPLEVKFKDTGNYTDKCYQCFAPGVLPELDLLEEVKICGPRYWPITFHHQQNFDTLRKLLHDSGYLYVKQRAGHLSYKDDPKGYRSILSQCLTSGQTLGKVIKPGDIKSFSSDPRVLAFADFFCGLQAEQDHSQGHLLSRILQECVSHEKLDALPVYVAIQKVLKQIRTGPSTLPLWQLRLVVAFNNWLSSQKQDDSCQLIGPQYMSYVQGQVEWMLTAHLQDYCKDLLEYLKDGGVTNAEHCHLVASFLIWNSLPPISALSQLDISGAKNVPQMYRLLKQLGLSKSLTISLSRVLSTR